MKFELKIGDRVKLRSYESLVAEYGLNIGDSEINAPCSVLEEMYQYLGKIVTISAVSTDPSWEDPDLDYVAFHIKEDEHGWEWDVSCIEAINGNTLEILVLTEELRAKVRAAGGYERYYLDEGDGYYDSAD